MVFGILYGFFILAIFIIFIISCVKKKIWIASLMTILYCFDLLFLTTLEIKFGLHDSYIVEGTISYNILVLVAVALTLIGIGVILLRKNKNALPASDPSWIRWLLFSFGILISMSGLIYFLMCVYTINPSGSRASIIRNGIHINILASFIGSFVLYLASRLNSINRPNLICWLVFFFSIFLINSVKASSQILLQAVPGEPQTAYVALSVLVNIELIPYSLILLGLTKDFFVPKETMENNL